MTAAVSAWGCRPSGTWITGAFRFMGQDPAWAQQAAAGAGSDLGYLGTRLFGFGSSPLRPARSPSLTGPWPAPTSRSGPRCSQPGRLRPVGVPGGGHVPALVAVYKDRLTSPAAARYMAEKIPGSRLLILEDAGHRALPEEHEVLDAEIAAFADEVLTGQGGRPEAPAHQASAGSRGPRPAVALGIEDLAVGHWTDPVGLTGCTVVVPPPGECGRGPASARARQPGRDRPAPAPGPRRGRVGGAAHRRERVWAVRRPGGAVDGASARAGLRPLQPADPDRARGRRCST